LKLSQALEIVIEEDIVYRMAIEKGIVNYSSLAKKINERVNKIMGKRIPLNTLVKALTRYKPKSEFNIEPALALNRVDISLEYDYNQKYVDKKELNELDFLMALKNDGKYNVILKEKSETGYALLKIKMKENYAEIPGITVLVISILEHKGIKIENIYRFGHEIWILVRSQYAPNAVETLAYFTSFKQ